jgi:hypothetical protein
MKAKHTLSILILLFLAVITKVTAQDFTMDFGILRFDNKPDSIHIFNINQNKEITVKGDQSVKLVAMIINTNFAKEEVAQIYCYPNPMTESVNVEIPLSEEGIVKVELYNLSSQKLAEREVLLHAGSHTFQVSGVPFGTYLLTVKTPNYIKSELLISQGPSSQSIKINLLFSNESEFSFKNSTNAQETILMQYNEGETIKFTGYLNGVSSSQEFIPMHSQLIEFELLPFATFYSSLPICPRNCSIEFFPIGVIGDPVSYEWDFGDGSTSIDRNPVHSYDTLGSFSVSLTVTNACGSSSFTRENHVNTYYIPGIYRVKTRHINVAGDTSILEWDEEIIEISIDAYRTTRVGHWDPETIGGNPGFMFYITSGSIIIPPQMLAETYANTVQHTEPGTIIFQKRELHIEYSISFGDDFGYYYSVYTPIE